MCQSEVFFPPKNGMNVLYLFLQIFFMKKNYSIWCGIFICTYMIFHIQVWLEILASF